jgi:putative colanic acid biosynthesis acetyltransferase WcaF
MNVANPEYINLEQYNQEDYTVGAAMWQQILWYLLGSPLVQSYWLPWSGIKVAVLRWFGATIGSQVRIKPGVRVKFPWRLQVGDHVWIGENAWLDNLALITIEDHVCISQSVYLCTGNHDWSSPQFNLRVAPIVIQHSAWIAAQAVVGPGVTIGKGTVLSLGSVACRSLPPMGIWAGNPAQSIKPRDIHDTREPNSTQAISRPKEVLMAS